MLLQTIQPAQDTEPIWKALADPTRRGILDLLRQHPMTTGELSEAFPSSRFAVMKHLGVLVEAGLVVARKRGRTRTNYFNPVPLQRLYERWVKPYEAHWAGSLLALKDHVEKGERTVAATLEAAQITQVELEVRIDAPARRVWSALVEETASWWRKDFYTVETPTAFVIEPQAGGRMFEFNADGAQVLWATVIAVQPGRSLDLVGHLTAAYGGPKLSMLHVEVEECGSGAVVKVSDSLMGRVSDESAMEIKDGWRLLFEEGLKPYVERSAS